MNELEAQNRVLRERLAQLEAASTLRADPLLRAMLEQAMPFLLVVNPEGRVLATGRASPGFGSIVGRSALDFMPEDQRPAFTTALAEVVRTARGVSFENVAFGQDGTPGHHYLVQATPVMTDGRVEAVVLVPVDISERVRLERSLAEANDALKMAVAASGVGLWRWDLSSPQAVWDARALELAGLRETPADFDAFLQVVGPEDRARLAALFRGVLETGVYPSFEHRVVTPEGAPERWLLSVGSVVKDASGKPTALMGGVVDISDKKRLEAQLARSERVEAIGRLSAGIAHNFNNLLTAVVSNVELGLARAEGEAREALAAALEASLQARGVVKSLLSLSRPEESSEPADIARVLAEVERLCRTSFPRSIELTFSSKAAGHAVMSAASLEQTLLNLLLNARDAVEGTQERRISVVAEQTGPNQLTLTVTDTGVGMSDEVRRQAFDPFFTTRSPHQGSGLGLSSALARVKQAGGQLDCESRVGHGTTFTLVLPLTAATTGKAEPVEPSAPGGTILVVDDEPRVRSSLRRLLQHEQYTVLEAGSAAEARAVLDVRGALVDLVLLDNSMPGETGVEAVASLRARSAAAVVLFTGLPPDEVPAAFAAVLHKPARAQELSRVLRGVLAARAGTGTGVASARSAVVDG
ncbi:MAG: PAS domain-containing protein [Myxococcus sp.]|nr:PAS domain-containing protein [Myxococcus sp.]